MPKLAPLEEAALRALIFQLPHPDAFELEKQIEAASVLKRENTGAGFLTYLACDHRETRPIRENVNGYDITAAIGDVPDALGFILWLRDGYMDYLEAYTMALDSTADLDPHSVTFSINPPHEPGLRPRLFADVRLYSRDQGGRSAPTPPTWLSCPCMPEAADTEGWTCRFLFEGRSMKPGETRRLGFIPVVEEGRDVLSRIGRFYMWESGIIGEATNVSADR